MSRILLLREDALHDAEIYEVMTVSEGPLDKNQKNAKGHVIRYRTTTRSWTCCIPFGTAAIEVEGSPTVEEIWPASVPLRLLCSTVANQADTKRAVARVQVKFIESNLPRIGQEDTFSVRIHGVVCRYYTEHSVYRITTASGEFKAYLFQTQEVPVLRGHRFCFFQLDEAGRFLQLHKDTGRLILARQLGGEKAKCNLFSRLEGSRVITELVTRWAKQTLVVARAPNFGGLYVVPKRE